MGQVGIGTMDTESVMITIADMEGTGIEIIKDALTMTMITDGMITADEDTA